jgi:hypothetical protein
MTLHFSHGNAKLNKGTLIFNLPAGKTCPGAMFCKSFAVVGDNGRRKIQDGPHTEFRCFAASGEVQFDQVFYNRADNFEQVLNALKSGTVTELVKLLDHGVQQNRGKNTSRVRIHESGDFFSLGYLQAWVEVAIMNPDLMFYCYSKSLNYFLHVDLPSNFYLTASYGGRFDYLIDEGYFPRYAKVVESLEVANSLGLPVDINEDHCFLPGPYALLVHNTQPKGSEMGKFAKVNAKVKKQLLEQLMAV